MSGQAGLGKGFGSKWASAFCTLSAWHCRASAAGVTSVLPLSRSCLGYDACSVLFQSSMEELGRGAHSPAGKLVPPFLPPSLPPLQEWGLMAVCFPPPHLMDQVFLPLAFQSQHLSCPGRALLRHSYCATAWGSPQTVGRGQEGLLTSPQLAPGLLAPGLPWAKPDLCNDGPATQDSPCACPWARPCLPWRCPAGTDSAGTAAMQCTGCDALLVLLSACMTRFRPQLLPAQLGLGTALPALPVPAHTEPTRARRRSSQRSSGSCAAPASLLLTPAPRGGRWGPAEAEQPLETVEDLLGMRDPQGATAPGPEGRGRPSPCSSAPQPLSSEMSWFLKESSAFIGE